MANFLERDSLVIGVMSLAFFGQGMCNPGWTLITDVGRTRVHATVPNATAYHAWLQPQLKGLADRPDRPHSASSSDNLSLQLQNNTGKQT
jgi:hypothetical protein